ncbi:hypothetical protein SLEP1_g51629 [Rubroshorea leprosula]|uniref:Uncharacterized protein n=1 Tax=Rubroshorea leprosula TaxID=152421 RepID=A0AAV5M4J2_9ROSI|nr:hypothetical protein SLEP1_g51629 [Rubroshorea leprosula]
MSPTHLWSWEWKPDGHKNCFDETSPIQEASYWGAGSEALGRKDTRLEIEE